MSDHKKDSNSNIKFKPEYVDIAHDMGKKGLRKQDVATFLNISPYIFSPNSNHSNIWIRVRKAYEEGIFQYKTGKATSLKECTNCKTEKPLFEFSTNKKMKDGVSSWCANCVTEKSRLYRRTKRGFVFSLYSSQKTRSINRGYGDMGYSKSQLLNWCLQQDKFHTLFLEWELSNYDKMKSPSIDRIDDYKGYEFGNIQLMTWGDNRQKSHVDRRSGTNTKSSKRVVQTDLNGEFIDIFKSPALASRSVGVRAGSIILCCSGKQKTSGGFKWRFVD